MENQSPEEMYVHNDVLLSSSSDMSFLLAAPPLPITASRSRTRGKAAQEKRIALAAANKIQQAHLQNETATSSSNNNNNKENAPTSIKDELASIAVPGALVNSKAHICHICNKVLGNWHLLRRHLGNHNAVLYSCTQCSKTFKHQSTLNSHKASHSVSLPFSCDICRKSFNRVSTLNSHRRIHSGAKTFACHVCNKAFYQKGNLKNHLFIHTNERPYRCEVCFKGFNQKSNLSCHRKNAHGIGPAAVATFACQHCDLKFNRAEQLAYHEMEVHLRPVVESLAMEREAQVVRVKTFVEKEGEPKGEAMKERDEEAQQQQEIVMEESDDLIEEVVSSETNETDNQVAVIDDVGEGSAKAPPTGGPNCQMIFQRTDQHPFFSKFSVIELPQKIDTLEIRYAEMTNKTPFAMLHFGDEQTGEGDHDQGEGAAPPCLVEIIQQRGMSILKPVKKHELSAYAFSADQGAVRNGKLVITIVATIIQSKVQFQAEEDYAMFTVKSPETVSCVKLLVDHDGERGRQQQLMYATGLASTGFSLNNCARGEELEELKNKITIAMSDCRTTGH